MVDDGGIIFARVCGFGAGERGSEEAIARAVGGARIARVPLGRSDRSRAREWAWDSRREG